MSKEIERCRKCDEPTGRAGIHDDSIFIEYEGDVYGPLCESCYEAILRLPEPLEDKGE